jgi:thiamine-monophosphate kinase
MFVKVNKRGSPGQRKELAKKTLVIKMRPKPKDSSRSPRQDAPYQVQRWAKFKRMHFLTPQLPYSLEMGKKLDKSLPKSRSAAFPSSGLGELGLIRQIRERVARQPGRVQLGIGDDCALLRLRAGEEAAVTTDLSIDGRHFRLGWHPANAIGHRTLARGLSDLAAMGARPVGAFLSLGLPRELTGKRKKSANTPAQNMLPDTWIGGFFDGLLALAEATGTPLAGGDLAESPVAVADVVLVGAVPRGRALFRSGARPGDQIYVTGALGGAAAGLARLADWASTITPGKRGNMQTIPAGLAAELSAHLYPQPRLAQGLWLQRRRLASAAIDVSDGLSTDLAHICEESRVAAEVDADLLPVHAAATLEQALHGGEDYELIFTAPEGVRIPNAIEGVAVTRIGRMVRRRAGRPQVMLVMGRERQPLGPKGWQHFS